MSKTIDIIIPCYNEEQNVALIAFEIDKHFKSLPYHYTLTFVDDGSTDNTYKSIVDLSGKRTDINIIKLSRNFGKEAAIAVGLKYCNSDAAIIIDSDLQHPACLIPALISEWEKGATIVDAVKVRRQKENIAKSFMAVAYNKIISMFTGMDFTGSSDYKLLDRKAFMLLNSIDEKNRFFRGLTNWVGLQHSRINFSVEERRRGRSKWNLFQLIRLSIDSTTSYSSKPLQLVTFLGIVTLLFSVILGLQTLYNKLFGSAVSGFTTVILVILILCSFIMISIGILGIYLAKIYDEVKSRPIYVVNEAHLCKNDENSESDVTS